MKYYVENLRTNDIVEYVVPSDKSFIHLLSENFTGYSRIGVFAQSRFGFTTWAILFIKNNDINKVRNGPVDFYTVYKENL